MSGLVHPDRIHFRGFGPKWRVLIGNTGVMDQGLTGFGCPFPDSSDHGKWSDEGPSSYDSPSSDESKGLELRNCGLIVISCLSDTYTGNPNHKKFPSQRDPSGPSSRIRGIQSIPMTDLEKYPTLPRIPLPAKAVLPSMGEYSRHLFNSVAPRWGKMSCYR